MDCLKEKNEFILIIFSDGLVISKILQLPSPEAVIKNLFLFLKLNSILLMPLKWAFSFEAVSFMEAISLLLLKLIVNNLMLHYHHLWLKDFLLF